MGLPWVRLDSAFPRNHKVLALLEGKDGHRALVTYVCGLSYSGEQGTSGFLPRSALVFIHGRPIDAQRLVDVQLWHPESGGWIINDWTEYQPTNEEAERRRVRAQTAAAARWEKRTGGNP